MGKVVLLSSSSARLSTMSSVSKATLNWPFKQWNKNSLVSHAKKLSEARERALINPLYPGWRIKWRFSGPLAEFSGAPQGRPLPQFLQNIKPGSSRELSLQIDYPIQSGVDMNAQIWIAHITRSNICIPASQVVLKLVQPSLRPIPLKNSETQYTYRVPEYMARSEADFYWNAKLLQGHTIPHFLGLQEVLIQIQNTILIFPR